MIFGDARERASVPSLIRRNADSPTRALGYGGDVTNAVSRGHARRHPPRHGYAEAFTHSSGHRVGRAADRSVCAHATAPDPADAPDLPMRNRVRYLYEIAVRALASIRRFPLTRRSVRRIN